MRRIVFPIACAFALLAAADPPAALTFDDVIAHAASDPVRLARAAELAKRERELSSSSRYLREGPTVDFDLGPRRIEDGAVRVQASARIEVPFLSGGGARTEADSQLRAAVPDIVAAERVESRFRLRQAYLDAWLAQERIAVMEAQRAATERLAAVIAKRVAEGAEAPYEQALIEGEAQRFRSGADAARDSQGVAWSALAALTDLPAAPQLLASPGIPELVVPDDAAGRFETGLVRGAAGRRASLDSAFADLDRSQQASRWSAAAAIGQEADDSFATVGAVYRFPNRGEGAALSRERAAADAGRHRAAQVEAARIETRFATVSDRVRRFGPVTPPDTFDDALRAVALRMELGRERPSQALIVRRQLLEACDSALARVRDAQLLMAELYALTAGEAP
jgi:cobalt-zinc-cadmium efflux system outer membrane protein